MISCSSNEAPNTEKPQQNPEPKYSELVGLWTTDTYTWNKGDSGRSFEVYNNGNIAFIYSNYRGSPSTNYTNTKKIDDNFDYPYTTKVISSGHPMYEGELTITFESVSKAYVSGNFVYGRENWRPITTNETHIYKKQ